MTGFKRGEEKGIKSNNKSKSTESEKISSAKKTDGESETETTYVDTKTSTQI